MSVNGHTIFRGPQYFILIRYHQGPSMLDLEPLLGVIIEGSFKSICRGDATDQNVC